MIWLYLTLIVLSPAILYGIALIATAIATKYYRRPCLTCGERGLKCVNFIRATIIVNGRRAPDYWSYYVCEKCGAEFKLHHDEWKDVPENERHYRRWT
jgi:hypothetical protein